MNSINETLIKDYKTFLDNGKTERECVEQIIAKKMVTKTSASTKNSKPATRFTSQKWVRPSDFFRLEKIKSKPE